MASIRHVLRILQAYGGRIRTMPENGTEVVPRDEMDLLTVSGIVVILGSGATVLRILYEEIILTSEHGPQMVGFSTMHIMPGAFILGVLFLLSLHIWLLIALAKIGYEAYRNQSVARSTKLVLSGALAIMILLYIP